ncbi:tRNA-splicing endonuclease subunit Sen15 isoform X3 [Gallus gallus]|uniref:tRNA-splicing endonuclease subunit Sen15 isoform X3 n=1 Tax=Gallus gallus TaxID=9031 RepID=UPI001AE68B57|nr:tRNA-splicing endonuclease subunit Sen15 isoform X3 [Gallus gallus]
MEEQAAGRAEEPCGPAEGGSGAERGWAGGGGGDWMATHPTFTAMMSLDISDSSQIYAAFLVYLDLLEGRSWHEVKHVGLAELQLVCLHAREREQGDLQVMVPIPADVLVSHESCISLCFSLPGSGKPWMSASCSTQLLLLSTLDCLEVAYAVGGNSGYQSMCWRDEVRI